MEKRIFTYKEILAIALHFFKKIDDIELSIIIDIIKRWFGNDRVSDISNVEELKEEIITLKKDMENGEVINEYHYPPVDKSILAVRPSISINPGYIFGVEIDNELFRAINYIYENPMEVSIRKIEYDSRFSNLSNYRFRDFANKARNLGFLEVRKYEITPKGNKESRDLAYIETLKRNVETFSQEGYDGHLDKEISGYFERRHIVPVRYSTTKKWDAFVLMQSYELRINEIKKSLIELGYGGYYIEDFFYTLCFQELDVNSNLNVLQYIKFCDLRGYNDCFVELEDLDFSYTTIKKGRTPRKHLDYNGKNLVDKQ